MNETMPTLTGSEIAVIGMSCRFPGAKNINEFWENLKNGVESNPFLSEEELSAKGIPGQLVEDVNFVKSKEGVLDNKEFFDAAFFGYTPREAEIMDPQMRLFFEEVWSTLEDAGYDPGKYDEFIGLYTGAGSSSYWEYLASLTGTFKSFGYFAANLLMNKDFVGTQVAYKLDLKGPCFTVQTACSTSLVAIHLACQGILNGECNMALAGGVRITHQRRYGYVYEEGMINSPDGHCRAFDSRSKGIFNGEGVGVVLLKFLEEALEDGDHIYALIKGTAINNDGLRKIGFTAPSIEGQAEAIRMAHQISEVDPETVGYIEAHGTGTELGDPVEIEGLKLAFKSEKRNFCGIGSVKTNIGHLDAAAGIAGFIKTVLALQNQFIPPSLHFEAPNPRINFENSPFYVANRLIPWECKGKLRRAGVSSFGLGGTNAHVVLEEWQHAFQKHKGHSEENEPVGYIFSREQLLLLSAKTPSVLHRMIQDLVNHFKENPNINLADTAYTLMVGRKDFEYRKMSVCKDLNHAIETLSALESQNIHRVTELEEEKRIIFMFSGQGSQYVDMGLELYKNEPVFREEMDKCFNILEIQTGYRIKDYLYPGETQSGLSQEEAKKKIDDVFYSGPIKFTIEYSLAKLLINWGIRPCGMIGHSFGEYTAAHLAGVFSLEDALKMVVSRGKLMEKTPPGAMMSIPLPAEEVECFLKVHSDISMAAINTPFHCIVSGPKESIATFERELNAKGHECLRINFPRASHSKMMKSILKEFEDNFNKVKFSNPKIPYIAGLSGDWVTDDEATDPGYWGRHMAETILFSKGIKRLLENPETIFIQVGCDSGLPLLVSKHLEVQSEVLRLNLLRHPREDVSDISFLLNSLGLLWQNGVEIPWPALYSQRKRNRISLPTYPFEGEYYWLDEVELKHRAATRGFGKKEIAQWFYTPSWSSVNRLKRCTVRNNTSESSIWLFLMKDPYLGENLLKSLQEFIKPDQIILVRISESFEKVSDRLFTVNPEHEKDFRSLFNELDSLKKLPQKIVSLWEIDNYTNPSSDGKDNNEIQLKGFFTFLFIVRAMQFVGSDHECELIALTNNIQNVSGDEKILTARSPLLSTQLVIPQEQRNISCRNIDLSLPINENKDEDHFFTLLLQELFNPQPEKYTAIRDNSRWIQSFHQIPIENTPVIRSKIKEGGIYLMVGGLEGVGLIVTERLAIHYKSKLVLLEESEFPVRDSWERWISEHDDRNIVNQKIHKIHELENQGSEIMVFNIRPTEKEEMQMLIKKIENEFGGLNGVIYTLDENRYKASGLISELDIIQSKEWMKRKANDLVALDILFRDKLLDFRLLVSSVLSFLGGLENSAYTAINIFADSYTQSVKRWISLNLEIVDISNTHEVDFWLSPEEACEAVELVLNNVETGQIIVSSSDIVERLKRARELNLQSVSRGRTLKGEQTTGDTSSLSPRPNLSSSYVMAVTETEKQMVKIWQDLLGFEDIGIEDNFFELGGNSLAAIEVKKRIRENFDIEIPVVKIMHYPTIQSLAGNVLDLKNHQEDSAVPQEDPAEIQEDLIEVLDKF